MNSKAKVVLCAWLSIMMLSACTAKNDKGDGEQAAPETANRGKGPVEIAIVTNAAIRRRRSTPGSAIRSAKNFRTIRSSTFRTRR
ncbi:MAG: hypothetical protein K0R28_4553 [Paenibacillus sp.]|nr:hypothetical protein [Paenibacillus sp.]